MHKKRPCMICFFKGHNLNRGTEYECANCKVPCCPIGCYDYHRNTKNLDDFLV